MNKCHSILLIMLIEMHSASSVIRNEKCSAIVSEQSRFNHLGAGRRAFLKTCLQITWKWNILPGLDKACI